MVFLLDTNAFSDLLREHPGFESRLALCGDGDDMIICTIVRGEIQFGIARLPRGRKSRELQQSADKLFARIRCEVVPTTAADAYSRIKVVQQRRGLSLDENDLWIAATAEVLGATIVTRDQDFSRIDGQMVEDWTV